MDFLGFHPMYVVILLALALIIFGPSRLPKMGAQVGRMLREFQAAREGLTQQMREAFEEEPNFGPSTGPTVAVAEEEPASEPAASTEGAVAVADRPLGETIAAGVDLPPVDAATPPESEGAGAGPVAAGAGESTPEIDLTEVAAAKSPAPQATSQEQEQPAAVLDPPQVTPFEEPANGATEAPPVQGVVPEGSATGGVVVESPAEDQAVTSTDDGPEHHEPSLTPGSSGTVVEAPRAGGFETPPAAAGSTPFASVAADHESPPRPRDEQAGPE